MRCFLIFARHTSVKADIVAPTSGLVKTHIMGSHDLLILLSRTSQVQGSQKVNDSLKVCLINFDFEKFIRNYAATNSMF